MAVPSQGQRLSHLKTSESQSSLSYGFHLACAAESSDGFYSSSHSFPLFHSSTSSCSTSISLCCCQFEWHVWELRFILRAVINACKWICGAVFSHKLWLKWVIKQFTGYILVQGNHCKAALHDYAVDTQKATRTGI